MIKWLQNSICSHFFRKRGLSFIMGKKRKKIVVIIIIIIAAAACVFFWFRHNRQKTGGGKDAAYVESVAEVTDTKNAGAQNRYSGVVESQKTWDISLASEQTVKEVFVQEGDEVTEGMPLFEYDTTDLTLQVAQAKLELEEIGNEITGYNSQIKALNAEKNTVSKDEQFSYTVQIQSLETQIKQAEYSQESKKMEIEKLQNTLSESTVTSKINGVVKSINQDNEMDNYGNAKPFMSILTTGDYRVKGVVNETNVWMLEEGAPVILRSRVDSNAVWYGTIENIDTDNQEKDSNNNYMGDSSDSDAKSTKYPFYISLSSSDGLMLGQHVYIELDEGQDSETEGLWLYSSYIVQDEAETPYVWADNGNGRLEKRTVEIGEYNEELDMYEILSGLTQDDLIAWAQPSLSEGMKTTENIEESSLMNEMSEDMYSADMEDMQGMEGEDMQDMQGMEGEDMQGMEDPDMEGMDVEEEQ